MQTSAAPSRMAVRTESKATLPPPNTTTFFPSKSISSPIRARRSKSRLSQLSG